MCLWNTDAPRFHMPVKRACQKDYACEIWKIYHLSFKSYGQCLSFWKVGQTSRSRSGGQKCWYQKKGLVIRNTHVKYESPITCHSKVMANVKFLKSRSNFKVKVRRSKIMVPVENACHKELTCVIWKSHELPFKSYGQC